MNLVKTSLLNSIAVMVKMLTMLSLNKLFAIYVGPAGYALVGQFQNFVQMMTTFSSGAITTGIVKYTAEYNGDRDKEKRLWRTCGQISLVGSFVSAIFIILFRKFLASWLLKDETLSDVFIWFAVCLVFFVFNSLLLAVLNGKKDIRRYVISNILGSVLGLVIIGLLATAYQLRGALVALAIYQSLILFSTLMVCRRAEWFRLQDFYGAVDRDIALKLGGFTLMALTSAACLPATQIFIRNYISLHIDMEHAGYWEAMARLSVAYMTVVTSILGVYYLPRLAEISSVEEIRHEIFNVYKLVLPLIILASIAVYFSRNFIISLLFSRNFQVMEQLFAWQMVGDVFKIAGWVAAYVYIGKAFFKLYIVSEILFAIIYCILSVLGVKFFGFPGTAMAYAGSYFLYFIFVVSSLRFKRVI